MFQQYQHAEAKSSNDLMNWRADFFSLFLSWKYFVGLLIDVECIVIHLKSVHCVWNKQGTPEVNYTFYGGFVKS